MNLRVVAKNDRGVFAGLETDGYVVLSLDDVKEIELGDILESSTWTDAKGLFKRVQNLTQKNEVKICIENWSCSKAVAYEFLGRMNSPTKVFTIEKDDPA